MNSAKLKIAIAAITLFLLSGLNCGQATAQERIDNLVAKFIDGNTGGTISYRSVVKRNPQTHEIERHVVELSVSNRQLGQQLIEAFEAEKSNADGVEISRGSSYYTATLVWNFPRRVYEVSVGGGWVSFSSVTEYNKEK